MHENPYQSPALVGELVTPETPAEELRKQHLRHEASIKSIAILYFLGSAVMILMGVMSVLANPYELDLVIQLLMGILLVGLGALQFWTALGLRSLKSWIKVPVAILSGIGLLAFPLGTLVNGYILYLVFSRKGKTILSQEYKHVITATPHIEYKTRAMVCILLGIFFTLLAIAILVAVVPATLGPR